MAVGFWCASLAILVALPYARGQECYECVSPDLAQQWHLIGYPKKVGVSDPQCNNGQREASAPGATPVDPGSPKVPCTSGDPCVIIAMKALDNEGMPSSGYWTLRGCYSTLMQDAPRKATFTIPAAPNDKMREIGKLTIANKKNENVDVPISIYTCKSTAGAAPCNGQQSTTATVEACATGDTFCTTVTSGKMCKMPKGEDRSCKFCAKFEDTFNGQKRVLHGGSAVSPFIPPLGKLDTTQGLCLNYKESLYLPPGGENRVDAWTCYCNDKDGCNGSLRIGASILSALLAFVVILRLL